jgi:hypothetical protein
VLANVSKINPENTADRVFVQISETRYLLTLADNKRIYNVLLIQDKDLDNDVTARLVLKNGIKVMFLQKA